jgi:hypothetical protein
MRRTVALIVLVLTVPAVAAGGGEPPLRERPLPNVRETRLGPAARAAGCTVRSHRDEGSGHVTGRVRYRTNPPTSGDHDPEPAEDGIYAPDNPPDVEQTVHALEHGRIAVQYRRGTKPTRVDQLEKLVSEKVKGGRGYHSLLFRNQTRMPYAVAATAWRRSLTCRTFNDGVFDAIRAFRLDRIDKGPEFVP